MKKTLKHENIERILTTKEMSGHLYTKQRKKQELATNRKLYNY